MCLVGSAIRLKVKVFNIQGTNSARPLAQCGGKDLLVILSAYIKGLVIKANKFHAILHQHISISHYYRFIWASGLPSFSSKQTHASIILVEKRLNRTLHKAVKDPLRQRGLVSSRSRQSDSIHRLQALDHASR